MNKQISNQAELIKNLIELVIGLLFFFFPVDIQRFIVLGGGILLIVYGVIFLIQYQKLFNNYFSFNALSMILIGLLLILTSSLIIALIPIVIGIILISRGALKFYALNSLYLSKKQYIIACITNALVILVGVILILFNGSEIIGKLIGGAIIIDAVISLLQNVNIHSSKKKDDDNIIDV